jgi:hypothetical protein
MYLARLEQHKQHVNAQNKKHINMAITVRLYIHIKYYTMHTQSRYQWAHFSSNRGAGTFLAVFHWCKNADLMTAGGGEADICSPWGLL